MGLGPKKSGAQPPGVGGGQGRESLLPSAGPYLGENKVEGARESLLWSSLSHVHDGDVPQLGSCQARDGFICSADLGWACSRVWAERAWLSSSSACSSAGNRSVKHLELLYPLRSATHPSAVSSYHRSTFTTGFLEKVKRPQARRSWGNVARRSLSVGAPWRY